MEAEARPVNSAPEDLSVAILILNWNGRSLLETCLPLLLNQTYSNYKIIVVDNGSTDASISFVAEKFPQIQVIQNEDNLGFSRGMNVGLRQITADVTVLLNNDVLVQPNWLKELIRPFTTSSEIGIVGCKLLYPDGTIQHLGAELSYPLAHSHHFHHKEADVADLPAIQDVPYVTGAAIALHRSVIDEIGLLDESFHPFYYEEADYCYRAKAAGFRVVVATQAVAIHNESTSINKVQDLTLQTRHRNRYRFVLKHYSVEQFLQEFVPAELVYLNNHPLFLDIDAVRLACLTMTILAPTILPEDVTEAQVTAVQNALLQLRKTAIQVKATIEAPPPPLKEFTFPATGSPVGAIAAKFRQAWGSVAAKWLVRRLLQEQTVHNHYLQRQIGYLETSGRTQAMEMEYLFGRLLPAE